MEKEKPHSWQDLRDMDLPEVYMNECKSLIKQIVRFTYSEVPILDEGCEKDVEKQDVSYRLLEEENYVLRSELLSLQNTIQSRDNEIESLKTTIGQLGCQIRERESRVEEVSLPGIQHIIKKFNSMIEEAGEDNTVGHVRDRDAFENENLRCETVSLTESMQEGDIDLVTASSPDLSSLQDQKSIQFSGSLQTWDNSSQRSIGNDSDQSIDNSVDGNFVNFKGKYFSLRVENLMLEEKIKTLIDKVQMLKSRNDFLEVRAVELENQTKQESLEMSQRADEVESSQTGLLECYKSSLYETFKEMCAKEDRIGQLNDSINNLAENFKDEKNTLEKEFEVRLRTSEERLKTLYEEKEKLEETNKQQSQLIDHLKDLMEDTKIIDGCRMNCLKDRLG